MDDALTFCRADGALLVTDEGAASESAGTLKLSASSVASETETRRLRPNARPEESVFDTDEPIRRSDARTTALAAQGAARGTRKLRSLKGGVTALVGATLALTLTGFAYLYFSWQDDAAIRSVAVLPFVNESGDANLDYLSDGLSESVIDRLSQLPQLKVIARGSSFKYRGPDVDAQQAARALGVEAIVTGRVAPRAGNLTIRVEMIDARENKHLWGEDLQSSGIGRASVANRDCP
jgi:TolB-like protein